jgi:hypothetical protein
MSSPSRHGAARYLLYNAIKNDLQLDRQLQIESTPLSGSRRVPWHRLPCRLSDGAKQVSDPSRGLFPSGCGPQKRSPPRIEISIDGPIGSAANEDVVFARHGQSPFGHASYGGATDPA